MNTVINTKVGINRGMARIWLEGKKIAHSFSVGDNYTITQDKENKRLILQSDPDGERSVSVRNRNNRSLPLIELKGDVVSELFKVAMQLRIVLRNGIAIIEIHGNEKKLASRVARFLRKLLKKETLEIGSVLTGLGVLDKAIHDGLADCGIDSYTKFAVERESKYVEALLSNQSGLFREDSIIVESEIEAVELRNEMVIDIFIGSLPCTGASLAGRTKNKIRTAEEHKDAGAAFYYWLTFVSQFQPAIIFMENVKPFLETASMAVIRSVLATFGYDLSETVLNGNDFGTLENRDRMCMVAVTKRLCDDKVFDLNSVKPFKEKPKQLSDVLENIAPDDTRWKEYAYLAEKEKRDIANGKGFRRSIYNGTEESVTTIRRLYHKSGSCDQFLKHPTDSSLTRLFTPSEHARIKGIDESLIAGLSDTQAHEMLGQSICFPAFQAVGRAIGNWCNELASDSLKVA